MTAANLAQLDDWPTGDHATVAAGEPAPAEGSPILRLPAARAQSIAGALAEVGPGEIAPSDRTALATLARRLGLSIVEDLTDRAPSQEFLEKIPIAFARHHKILGLASENGHLRLVICDPKALAQAEVVGRFLNCTIRPLLATSKQILAAINRAYQQRTGEAKTLIQKLDKDQVLDELRQLEGREDLLDVASRSPVIKLVNLILFEAVQGRASDVHVQPYEDSLVVRMRIDGVLYNAFTLPKSIQEEVVSRVKVMGRMNIAEKRLPQDGRATVDVGDRTIDLRIASLPTSFGERVVIRLLDKSVRLYSLEELGMSQSILAAFRDLVRLEHGLILVTGPTGSGKSTTLYAALRQMDATEKNILTLEDPIEFRLQGISQTQVSEKKGMTFAGGLRSVLRQDPDVIMVGEIRDRETATMAIQSALTGHLVLSTLHTNDAASAVTRLLDLGIEPYLLASSLVGVLAQRLVRRVCPHCGHPRAAAPEELAALEINAGSQDAPVTMRIGEGCEHCRGTGYRGRVGIFELLLADDAVRSRIQTRATAAQIKSAAQERGMKSLRDDGVTKTLAGQTTLEEVVRVTIRGNGF